MIIGWPPPSPVVVEAEYRDCPLTRPPHFVVDAGPSFAHAPLVSRKMKRGKLLTFQNEAREITNISFSSSTSLSVENGYLFLFCTLLHAFYHYSYSLTTVPNAMPSLMLPL